MQIFAELRLDLSNFCMFRNIFSDQILVELQKRFSLFCAVKRGRSLVEFRTGLNRMNNMLLTWLQEIWAYKLLLQST